jgi:hypothetical protein
MLEIKDDTTIADLLAQFPDSTCTPGLTWIKQFSTWGECSKSADKDIDPSYEEAWGIWYLINFGESTGVESRLRLLTGIHDPMHALKLYTSLEWLTSEEDTLLQSKFKGKLPTAEAELKTGTVVRSKAA